MDRKLRRADGLGVGNAMSTLAAMIRRGISSKLLFSMNLERLKTSRLAISHACNLPVLVWFG